MGSNGVPTAWSYLPLAKCGQWLSGGTPNTGVSEYWGGDIPWITASSLHSFQVETSERRLTQLGLANGSRLVPKGSILFVVRGMSLKEEFRVGIAVGPVAFGQDCKAIIPNGTVDPLFLAYALRSKAEEILGLVDEAGHGTGRLQTEVLKELEIPLPPLPEQRAIAHVLATLDDKIELNRRMNETLEAIARALFKSWFVDFDPVLAKAEGRDTGLPSRISELFPDSFEDSEVGPVPSRWKVSQLGSHVTAERGLSYNGAGLRDDGTGLPMHNLNSIYEGGGYKHEGIKFYDGEYREKHFVRAGDIIITNTEQGFEHLLIGHAAIVPERYGSRGLFSHHVFRIGVKAGSPFTPHYLVQLFNESRWHQLISGFSNGTTINMLPLDALVLPLVVVPPEPLIAAFSRLAGTIHSRIEASGNESRTLAALRDALLPKLISGELRAKGAERVGERRVAAPLAKPSGTLL